MGKSQRVQIFQSFKDLLHDENEDWKIIEFERHVLEVLLKRYRFFDLLKEYMNLH